MLEQDMAIFLVFPEKAVSGHEEKE